jgi:hypothetical protein
MKKILAIGALLASFNTTANDEKIQIRLDKLYVGGGVSQNVIDSPFGGSNLDASGFSLFAGYTLNDDIEQVDTSVELGYSQTGDFVGNNDISGVWLSAVAQKHLPEIDHRLSALARAGVDFGDDDGMFMGFGAAFQLIPQLDIRAEFINKDASTVYQLAAIYKF